MAYYRRQPKIVQAFTFKEIKEHHDKERNGADRNKTFYFHNIAIERMSDESYLARTETNKIKLSSDDILVIDHDGNISSVNKSIFKIIFEDL